MLSSHRDAGDSNSSPRASVDVAQQSTAHEQTPMEKEEGTVEDTHMDVCTEEARTEEEVRVDQTRPEEPPTEESRMDEGLYAEPATEDLRAEPLQPDSTSTDETARPVQSDALRTDEVRTEPRVLISARVVAGNVPLEPLSFELSDEELAQVARWRNRFQNDE